MNQLEAAAQILPLERLRLPSDTDGSQGSNRALRSECQIDADNDLAAIHCWLEEFDDSRETYRSYRRESERLLLWALLTLNKPVSSLTRCDFRAYELFLADPQPHDLWCGPRVLRQSPHWKPFTGTLSQNSRRQSLVIINALMRYWVDAGYLKGNPLCLIRRRNKKLQPDVEPLQHATRYLDQACWGYLKTHLSQLPVSSPKEQFQAHRLRLLFHLLYLLALRISEVAALRMNSFRELRGHWWCFVVGKGQKKAKIPVSHQLLDAICCYRQFLGLSPLPNPDDQTALLRSIRGSDGITANMVHRLVKTVVSETADGIQDTDPLRAKTLRQASTHWFRHTSITHQDDAGIGLKYLKQNARHAKVETTAIYQHADDALWHLEMTKHQF